MSHPRDITLTYSDVDDVSPAIATRILLPRDADASTSDIDEIPLERFVGRGIVVRVPGAESHSVITYPEVADQIADVVNGDIVLFDTGWGRLHAGSERAEGTYESDHPTLDPAIVAALIVRGVLAIGIDAPRIDPPGLNPGPCAHMIAAANGILCVNMTNLEDIDFANPMVTLTPGERLTRTSHRVDATAVALG